MVSATRTNTLALAAIAFGVSVSTSLVCQADEIVLIEGVDGYEGVRDTTLYERNPDHANGAGDHLHAGYTDRADAHRALIEFDLSGLPFPPDAVITGAELRLVTSRTRALMADRIMSIHRLTEDWGEGDEDTSLNEGRGTKANPGSATWSDNFFGSSTWATAGGDYEAVASDTQLAGDVLAETIWSGPGVLADVQAWYDNAGTNHGWIIIGNETKAETSVRFFSADNDEGATVDQFPSLKITYDPGPMVLEANNVRRNQTASFRTSNAVPGTRVYYLYSFTGAGSTFVPILGIPVDLGLPIENFGNSLADANGVSDFDIRVPGIAPLRSISFQSVHLRTGDVGRKSNRVDTTIMP